MKLAVAATAPFGADVLERLAGRHDVTALLTRPDAPRGRGRKSSAPPAKETAERLGIPVLQPNRPEPGLDLGADTVGVGEVGATYAEKITAEDRELDWEEPPEELLNRIRALSPHIGARAELHGRPVTIWKARVAGGRLEPLEVQPDGKRRMTYDEFLRGLR